jgi:hypothetical protein
MKQPHNKKIYISQEQQKKKQSYFRISSIKKIPNFNGSATQKHKKSYLLASQT